MMINKIDNSQSFKSVYKMPNAKKADIRKFEEVIALLYRSNTKKSIRGIDAGAKGFFALTENDAIEFDKYHGNIQRQGKGFIDIFKEDVANRMYNVVKLLNNRDHIYTNHFLVNKTPKIFEDFAEFTQEIFKK